jgi:hypothetical protein
MKVFKNISIIDSVDLFCSTIGDELVYEKNGKTNLLIPIFNVGFYENQINQSSITKTIDVCYFLFESVKSFEANLSTYESLLPTEKDVIDFDGNKYIYSSNFGEQATEDVTEYEIEGTCFRINSFSYGSYKIHAENLAVILIDESKFSEVYSSNVDYKSNSCYKDFLLNQKKEYLTQAIKAANCPPLV